MIDLFESYINIYFSEISGNEKEKIFKITNGLSLKYLKKSLNFLNNIYENNKKYKNEYLGILFASSYIKIYLIKFIDIIMNDEEKQLIENFPEIIEILDISNKNDFRKVLKLYILKLIKKKLGSYEKLKSFNFNDLIINNANFENEDNTEMLYQIIPFNKLNIYKEELKNFINIINETKNYKSHINLNKIDLSFIEIYMIISINKIIIPFYEKDSNKKLLENFKKESNLILSLFPLEEKTEKLKKILELLFFSKFSFLTSIITITEKHYILFLYILLIIYPSITKGKKTYISSLIDFEIIIYIKLNYIPCLIQENTFKKSLYEIEDFLNNNDYKSGAYICSCGNWYKILECGLPLYTFNCPFCKEIIGGTFHIPYDRNGHYRIFKDKSQEDFVMKWVNENNWLKKIVLMVK